MCGLMHELGYSRSGRRLQSADSRNGPLALDPPIRQHIQHKREQHGSDLHQAQIPGDALHIAVLIEIELFVEDWLQ